jgi:CheY-like chemotaxis protein
MLNLVVNARDAMPRGGRVELRTANVELTRPSPAVHASVPAGSYALIEVSDTGTGMDAATQARIFDPFFTTKEPGKGTGLGLSTVWGIVAQSGGHVHVDSAPGRGTTFRIYLPVVEVEAAAADRPESPWRSQSGRETILVVEDEDAVRTLVQHVLATNGYTVLVASGAEEAFAIAAQHAGPIDLLLTDVVMPGVSGPDLAERFRLTHPHAVVLYMSGYTEHPAVLEAAGESHGFLQKPFKPQTLAEAVRQRLDGQPRVG